MNRRTALKLSLVAAASPVLLMSANRDAFAADPVAYAPQYGGYCAYAIAIDQLVPIDPTQFTLLDGKLYLNYSPRIQRRWDKNRAGYLADSEKNWPSLIAKINENYKS